MDNQLMLTTALPSDRNPAAVYLASLSKGSLPAQRSALNQIAALFGLDARTLDWSAIRYAHTQLIRTRLAEKYAASTANRLLTALRRVLREAYKLGYIPEPEYRMLADIEPIRGAGDDTESGLQGRALSQGELLALMNACISDPTPAGARDAAIIALGYALGLRRAEISKLQLADYDPATSIIRVRSGKGNKSRTLPISDGGREALDDWIKVRGSEPGAMFKGINKGGKIASNALGLRAINELFEKRVGQANIEDANFHDLRRSTISDLLDGGVDAAMIAKIAGHSDTRTTLRYDRRTMDKRRTSLQTLHIPYTHKTSKTRKPK